MLNDNLILLLTQIEQRPDGRGRGTAVLVNPDLAFDFVPGYTPVWSCGAIRRQLAIEAVQVSNWITTFDDQGKRTCWIDGVPYEPTVYEDVSRAASNTTSLWVTGETTTLPIPSYLAMDAALDLVVYNVRITLTASTMYDLPDVQGMGLRKKAMEDRMLLMQIVPPEERPSAQFIRTAQAMPVMRQRFYPVSVTDSARDVPAVLWLSDSSPPAGIQSILYSTAVLPAEGRGMRIRRSVSWTHAGTTKQFENEIGVIV
jgi:hypothetical protein